MKKIVGLTIVSLLLLGACQKDVPPATTESTPPPDVISEKAESKLKLQGSEIFSVSAEGEKKLFTNVSKVEAMRMGPDGKTIHFKVTQPRLGENRVAHCANLETQARPIDDAGYTNPPPTQAPWDFQRIANAYTIKGCGLHGGAGGYLDTGDFFAYLKEAKSGELTVVVEALADDSMAQISIPAGGITGLSELKEDEDFGVAGFVNAEGERFFYPQEDAVLKDGLLVLAFGEKIVAVDTKAKKLIGTEYLSNPPYSIVAFSFWFHSKPNLPFVVVESGWEGHSGFSVLLDIENGALYTHRLEQLAQANTNGYQAEFLQWDDQGLTLNFYKEVDITDQAMKKADPEVAKLMKGIEKSYSETEWNALEKKLDDVEASMRATGKYVDVLCQFPGMAGGGCMGLTKGTTYRVTPGSGLKELK